MPRWGHLAWLVIGADWGPSHLVLTRLMGAGHRRMAVGAH